MGGGWRVQERNGREASERREDLGWEMTLKLVETTGEQPVTEMGGMERREIHLERLEETGSKRDTQPGGKGRGREGLQYPEDLEGGPCFREGDTKVHRETPGPHRRPSTSRAG